MLCPRDLLSPSVGDQSQFTRVCLMWVQYDIPLAGGGGGGSESASRKLSLDPSLRQASRGVWPNRLNGPSQPLSGLPSCPLCQQELIAFKSGPRKDLERGFVYSTLHQIVLNEHGLQPSWPPWSPSSRERREADTRPGSVAAAGLVKKHHQHCLLPESWEKTFWMHRWHEIPHQPLRHSAHVTEPTPHQAPSRAPRYSGQADRQRPGPSVFLAGE